MTLSEHQERITKKHTRMLQDPFELSTILHALYGSIADRSAFHAWVSSLSRRLGAHSGVIGLVNTNGQLQRLAATPNFRDDREDIQSTHAFRRQLLSSHVGSDAQGVLDLSEVMTESEFARSDYYNHHCKALGIFHLTGGWVKIDASNATAMIGIHRERRLGAFDERTKHQLNLLLPHLKQALELRARLGWVQMERSITTLALESLSVGILVIDVDGRIRFANVHAESLLRGRSGLAVRNGRLHLDNPQHNQLLRTNLRRATASAIGSPPVDELLNLDMPGSDPLSLRISSMPPQWLPEELQGPHACIFTSSGRTRPPPLRDQLRQRYGLTPAEARLAEAIAQGDSLTDYSARQQISINTAKTLLKRIFSKSGHRRQTQFLRDVLGNPLLRMDLPPS